MSAGLAFDRNLPREDGENFSSKYYQRNNPGNSFSRFKSCGGCLRPQAGAQGGASFSSMLRLRSTLASRRSAPLRATVTRAFASGPIDRRCARTEKFDKKATLVFADGTRFEVRLKTSERRCVCACRPPPAPARRRRAPMHGRARPPLRCRSALLAARAALSAACCGCSAAVLTSPLLPA